ncbi:MAG: hypothetical protein V3R65_01900 [Acidiferrobacterales bacterium]
MNIANKQNDVALLLAQRAKHACHCQGIIGPHNGDIQVTEMSNLFGVLLNGIAQLEFDRSKPLPDHQGAYLDKMDSKMDAGILLGEESISNPDMGQRTQFVAANLAHAIKANDESTAAAMCSWLASRVPDLKQVKFNEVDGEFSIDLVFDEDYIKQIAVAFPKLH